MLRFNLIALAGALAATSATVVAASPAAANATTRVVRVTPQDVATEGGLVLLDQRIARAAAQACHATGERQLALVDACRRQAIATAQDRLADRLMAGADAALRG